MYRLTHKLLSILLIFLLGFSPLQSAMVEIDAPVDTTTMPCHMSDQQTDMNQHTSQTTITCEMCSDHNECNNTGCSYSQSTSNVVVLLQAISLLTPHPSSLVHRQAKEDISPQHSLTLFRPPRV